MKFLFDYIPLFLFFGVYKWAGGNEDTAYALVSQYLSAFISGGVAAKAQVNAFGTALDARPCPKIRDCSHPSD